VEQDGKTTSRQDDKQTRRRADKTTRQDDEDRQAMVRRNGNGDRKDTATGTGRTTKSRMARRREQARRRGRARRRGAQDEKDKEEKGGEY
jgi:hypothetical protein